MAPAALALEGGSGIINGVCGIGRSGDLWEATRWCGAVRGDLLFGRERDGEAALGVSSSLATASFEEATWTVGAAGLAPFTKRWVGELSVGPMARWRDGAAGAGVSTWAFVGSRRRNPWGRYSMAWSFAVGYEASFGAVEASVLTVGIRLDGVVLALPALLAWEGLRGRPR